MLALVDGHLSWPDTVAVIGVLAFLAFIMWIDPRKK